MELQGIVNFHKLFEDPLDIALVILQWDGPEEGNWL